MASISNHERVTRALDQLSAGLRPYVAREMEAVYGRNWQEQARRSLTGPAASKAGVNCDSAALLGVMWSEWNSVFKTSLGHTERSLVSELRNTRNCWAHEEQFSNDDVYRALDSMHRLLTAVAAPEAAELDRQKQEALRVRFAEQAKREKKRASVAGLEGAPTAGLLPWREVATPHADVAGGHYQQAEFAADLGQVHRGEGSTEYRDPRAFYQRTFLTEGLRHLLTGALRRLSGGGGDPVVKLQTNFGGGKTHSMLALYHLVSGTAAADLPGIDPVLEAAGVAQPPRARRAVLVGTALSPGQPGHKPDGTVVNTLWGELAWQLGGAEGYGLVAESDRAGTNPGEALRTLFQRHAPCLILIDEWVAFVRQLYGKNNLPAGDFEANLTFAQWLTEAAKAVPGVLVVASLPASDIEIGGEGGREALRRLEHTFARVESTWRPASAEEGFEIVRRRLFEPITDPEKFRARDTVVQAFVDYYRQHRGEFPPEVGEADYARRLTAAYPIHPELFDRLYNDWSALENFQRTRGVLRLMAAVIHALWSRNDRSLLILPASVPVDDSATHFELTRYVEDAWVPIIEQDVDGPHSLPLGIDQDNPNLGRYSATRRVARTLYLGSAPTVHATHKGLEDRRIKLGAAQPGESVHTFGDALRRLADRANHIYQNGSRYWYALQPSVNRLAEERAAQQRIDDVHLEIIAQLKADARQRGDFPAVHVAPAASGDIPDDREVRLIVLDPLHSHSRGTESSAKAFARDVLDSRGTGPRRYRNQVVFLAPDATRLAELEQAVRQFLAWSSILEEKKALNLDIQQTELATTKRGQAEEAIRQRVPETYIWLLVPMLANPQASAQQLEWQDIRLQGAEALAARASRKLRNDGLLNTQYAGSLLRMELDRIPLWRGDHVLVRDLADFFAQYLYLPRLRSSDVLLAAIQDGVQSIAWESDGFGYADGFDPERERYRGLRLGELVSAALNGDSVVVKPETVQAQLDRERPTPEPVSARMPGGTGELPVYVPPPPGHGALPVRERSLQSGIPDSRPKRFYGAVTLGPERLTRDMGNVAQEVVAHLVGLVGAEAEITLDIQIRVPDGVPPEVIRTVMENARTLRFTSANFEPE